ncbi:MAG: hypothetical protein AB7U05_02555 [Mangrovibacterium sp.]
MYRHEELYQKICENFHDELNPLLEQLDETVIKNYWFDRCNIYGKFFLLKDLLVVIKHADAKPHLLVRLRNTLKGYKKTLQFYYDSNPIASGFVYFMPENIQKTEPYFYQFDYSITDHYSTLEGYSMYCLDFEVVGFPNDCSFKLISKMKDGEIIVYQMDDPIFEIEIERGKLIGNPQITRGEQNRIEQEQRAQNYESYKKKEARVKDYFYKFAFKVKKQKDDLLADIDQCIELCSSLIAAFEENSLSPHLAEIERFFSALNGSYIDIEFQSFADIFSPNYSGSKVPWLKTGPELKYFVDNLNRKLNLSPKINQWTSERFEMPEPISDMASYLGKQTSKDEYKLLIQGNLRRNQLFLLFRE